MHEFVVYAKIHYYNNFCSLFCKNRLNSSKNTYCNFNLKKAPLSACEVDCFCDIIIKYQYAGVAQLVEHRIRNA